MQPFVNAGGWQIPGPPPETPVWEERQEEFRRPEGVQLFKSLGIGKQCQNVSIQILRQALVPDHYVEFLALSFGFGNDGFEFFGGPDTKAQARVVNLPRSPETDDDSLGLIGIAVGLVLPACDFGSSAQVLGGMRDLDGEPFPKNHGINSGSIRDSQR